jgi:hypothetical protein
MGALSPLGIQEKGANAADLILLKHPLKRLQRLKRIIILKKGFIC